MRIRATYEAYGTNGPRRVPRDREEKKAKGRPAGVGVASGGGNGEKDAESSTLSSTGYERLSKTLLRCILAGTACSVHCEHSTSGPGEKLIKILNRRRQRAIKEEEVAVDRRTWRSGRVREKGSRERTLQAANVRNFN